MKLIINSYKCVGIVITLLFLSDIDVIYSFYLGSNKITAVICSNNKQDWSDKCLFSTGEVIYNRQYNSLPTTPYAKDQYRRRNSISLTSLSLTNHDDGEIEVISNNNANNNQSFMDPRWFPPSEDNRIPAPLNLLVDVNLEHRSVIYEVTLGRELGIDIVQTNNGAAVGLVSDLFVLTFIA